MDKTRLLILTPGPNYDLEYTFRSRCEALSGKFEGYVLTSGPRFERRRYGGFSVVCIWDPVPKSVISLLGFVFRSSYLVIRSIFHGKKIDLVITYDPLKTGLVGLFVSRLFRLKLAVEVNGDYANSIIYSHIRNKYKRALRKNMMVAIERIVLRASHGVKLLYDNQVDYFKPLRNDVVIRRFPDYVNGGAFSNLADEKVILFAGFPFKVKGVDILISAFKMVSDSHPEWKLKILGWYPDTGELYASMGGHPKICHHKPVPRAEMPDHIGRCGIFVLPSRTEAMGRVLIEAMAASKPRVGANVGGIPTVINDGVDGILFEKENVTMLAEILDRLMRDEVLRKKLGAKARERYEDEFVSEVYYDRLVEFYGSVVERG